MHSDAFGCVPTRSDIFAKFRKFSEIFGIVLHTFSRVWRFSDVIRKKPDGVGGDGVGVEVPF